MNGGNRRRRESLQNEVSIRYCVERIRGWTVEAELFRCHCPVERERGAGQRGGAERALIEALARIAEAAPVPRGHFHIGEKMVAEGDGLRGLEMRKARHHGCGMRQRLFGEGALRSE